MLAYLKHIRVEYLVKVDLKPEAWFKSIEIAAGKTQNISVPPPDKVDAADGSQDAGGAEDRDIQGNIQVMGKNAKGYPLESFYKYYVYASGSKEKWLAEESVSNPVNLPPGAYDVRVEFMPDIWFESVEVVAGQNKQIELPLPGRLNVQGKNALGDSYGRSYYYTIYKSGNRKERHVSMYINNYKDLPAGMYDIQVNLNPGIWYAGIEIIAGETRVISLSPPGRLEIRGTDAEGRLHDAPFSLYTGSKREKPLTTGVVNTPLEMQPGVYDISVDLETGAAWFSEVEIVSRQSNILELSPPGRIWIYGSNEAGDPLNAEFTVYSEGEGEKDTAAGRLNETVDLPAGTYDVKISLEPEVWYSAVKVVGGQVRIINLSKPPESIVPDKEIATEEKMAEAEPRAAGPDVPSGILEVRGKDASGEPISGHSFHVFAQKESKEAIEFGYVNEAKEIPPGTYDIRVKLVPEFWFERVEIKKGETTALDLPQAGRIKIRGKDADGKPLRVSIWVYVAGDRDKLLSGGYTNEALDIWAGTYDIVVDLDPDIRFDGTKILEGQDRVVDLPDIGYAQLTAVPEEGAEPYKETDTWWIYPIGADGKPSKKYIVASHDNPSGKLILPPGRYFATINVGKGDGETEFEVTAGETIEKSVVIKVGYAELTVVPKEGAEPYKKAGTWWIYPMGPDGRPSKKYIVASHDNPSGKLILPPGRYFATINVGKGHAEIEFEVKTLETTSVTVVVDADAKAEINGEDIYAYASKNRWGGSLKY